MNKLSADLVVHIVSFVNPTESRRIARATCRILRNALPIEKLIGINKETAEWLLANTAPERWLKPSMRHEDFTVCAHARCITIFLRSGTTRVKNESHQPLSKHYAFPTLDDHRCILSFNRDNVTSTLSIMHNLDEDEDELIVTDRGDEISAFCELPGTMYLATTEGVVFSLDMDQPTKDISKDFMDKVSQIQDGTAMLMDFERLHAEQDEVVINKMSTTDGITFTFLINSNLIVHCKPSTPPLIIESEMEIKDFWPVTPTAIVCWLDDDTLQLMSFTLRRFTASVPISWPNTETSVIHITPELKSIWVLDYGMRMFRFGAPCSMPAQITPEKGTTKSAEYYRSKSNRLIEKLRKQKARNAMLTIRLEAIQDKMNLMQAMQV